MLSKRRPRGLPCRKQPWLSVFCCVSMAWARTQGSRGSLAQQPMSVKDRKSTRLNSCSPLASSPIFTPVKLSLEAMDLVAIKSELGQLSPRTVLLEVGKEAALDTGLVDAFETSASGVALSKAALAQRRLLCLYGLGTNAGLKRVAGATPDVSYEELLHVHRRFTHAPALREACARVANATLAIRNAAVWGDAGTACASDSTKFGAWDRNLMTE